VTGNRSPRNGSSTGAKPRKRGPKGTNAKEVRVSRGIQAGRRGKPLKSEPHGRNWMKKARKTWSGVKRQGGEKPRRRKGGATGTAAPGVSALAKRTLYVRNAEGEETPREKRVGNTCYGVPREAETRPDDQRGRDTKCAMVEELRKGANLESGGIGERLANQAPLSGKPQERPW